MNKLHNPFVGKSAPIIDDEGDIDALRPLNFSQQRRLMPYMNYMLFSNSPYWQTLDGLRALFDWFHNNPIFYAVVMIKAREYANMRIMVANRRTGIIEDPIKTRKALPQKIYALFDNPNVMQSRWEFFMQRKIFEEVCGNSMTYGNFALGFKPSVDVLSALWNVWPAYMKFKLTGNYFEATQKSDIIKEWSFQYGQYQKVWEPHEILHKNKPNTRIEDGLIFGRSAACSLIRPLTNIDMAYESRNVLMRNRGMRVMITSNKGDANGLVPLQPDEKEEVEKAMRQYGMLEHQNQFFFSPQPLTAVPIDQDVSKLGLFEEIATDAMMVCNAYGVPDVLLKLYIKGATFENQEASVRRLYQGTLIPEAEDDMIALGNFLGLADTEWMLVPSFEHVSALQESKAKEQERESKEKETAMAEFKIGLITVDEYRERMGYGPMPVPDKQQTETTPPDDATAEESQEG